MASHSAAVVTERYTRSAQLAVVTIAAAWHLAMDLPATIGNLDRFRSPGAVVAAWAIFGAVGALGTVRLLRARPGPAWPLLALLVAADAMVLAAAPPDLFFTAANWAWGALGWFVMIVLWHRPIRDFLAVLAVNAGLSLGAVLAAGGGNRVDLGRWAMVVYGTGALQLALKAGAEALNTAAAQAAESATALAAVDAERAAAAELHRARGERYRSIRAGAGAVLADLAEGRGDPADPQLRRRCTLEASRLRRLIAEADDVPDPLLHELRACADLAERRGVVVDLVSVGQLPDLPVAVRRALAEPLAQVLAATRTGARVAVAGTADTVAVSVVADGDVTVLAPAEAAGVTVTCQDEGGRLWVETRWRRG